MSEFDRWMLGLMGVCLVSYIAGHFLGNPFPDMLDMVKWFGLALGITTVGSKITK